MRGLLNQLVSLLLGFVLGSLLPLLFYQWTEEVELAPVSYSRRTEPPDGCVCGERAEELRRLAKINLYVSKLGNSSTHPSTAGSSSARGNTNSSRGFPSRPLEPGEEAELREFLYPKALDSSNRSAPLLGEPEHKLLQDEYLFKRTLFVGVLTQQAYLETRAQHLYETWGREVDRLMFFVGEDCEVPASLSHLPIVKLEGIEDKVYPPLKKTFAVMKYMYDHFLHQYNWFVRADDDMYVRTAKLKELLSQMHPYEKVYLGRSGTGRKDDLERLHLLPHERYCMGGPGIILSMAALRNLGPHLTSCLSAGRFGI